MCSGTRKTYALIASSGRLDEPKMSVQVNCSQSMQAGTWL